MSEQERAIINSGQRTNQETIQEEGDKTVPYACIYLVGSEKPGEAQWCKQGCPVKCTYSGNDKELPNECELPEQRTPGGLYCQLECRINCPYAGKEI